MKTILLAAVAAVSLVAVSPAFAGWAEERAILWKMLEDSRRELAESKGEAYVPTPLPPMPPGAGSEAPKQASHIPFPVMAPFKPVMITVPAPKMPEYKREGVDIYNPPDLTKITGNPNNFKDLRNPFYHGGGNNPCGSYGTC